MKTYAIIMFFVDENLQTLEEWLPSLFRTESYPRITFPHALIFDSDGEENNIEFDKCTMQSVSALDSLITQMEKLKNRMINEVNKKQNGEKTNV